MANVKRRESPKVIGLSLALCLCLAGCGQSAQYAPTAPDTQASTAGEALDSVARARYAAKSAANMPMAEGEQGASTNLKAAFGVMMNSTPDRYLIKTATVMLEVADVKAAMNQLLPSIQELNGYVSNLREQTDNLGRLSATLQIRIPAEQFDQSMSQLDALGKVLSRQIATQDITEEYIDTDSTTRNLKKTEERLLDHLTRAGKLEDILRVEQELNRVREQIERLDGRLRFLGHRVAFSTISLTIAEAPKAEPLVPPEGFSSMQVASQAFRSLVALAQVVWVKTIWVVIWTPIWLPLLVAAWLIVKRIRAAQRIHHMKSGNHVPPA